MICSPCLWTRAPVRTSEPNAVGLISVSHGFGEMLEGASPARSEAPRNPRLEQDPTR